MSILCVLTAEPITSVYVDLFVAETIGHISTNYYQTKIENKREKYIEGGIIIFKLVFTPI